MQTANTDTPLRRGRLFIVALLALFTGGAAVSMRAATAVHMRTEYLDPIDPANAGAMLGTALGAAFAGFADGRFGRRKARLAAGDARHDRRRHRCLTPGTTPTVFGYRRCCPRPASPPGGWPGG